MRALLIINPGSGRPRNRAAIRAAIDSQLPASGIDAEIVTCLELSDLDAHIARAHDESFEAVIAVGGDGSVHEVAKRLVGSELALGIIPTGSGNGLARHLGMPMNAADAVTALASGRVETVDTAMLNGRPFFGVAGIGFDALIAHRFAASAQRGLESYVFEVAKAFLTFEREEYAITIDGREIRQKAFIVAVANSAQYGNEARVAPHASMQDGLFDVSIVEKAPLSSAPSMLRRLFEGTFEQSPYIEVVRGSAVEISRAAAGPAHLDGEAFDMPQHLRFTLMPRSLHVIVPRRTTRI